MLTLWNTEAPLGRASVSDRDRQHVAASGMPLTCGSWSWPALCRFFATLWQNPALAWKSYVVNWSYFASIAMGGVMVAVVTWIVKAKWNWPVRRIHQSFAAYLPIAFVLFIPMLLSLREDYFPWIEMMADDPIVQKKAAWLNIPFLVSRNLVGVLALFAMACGFVYLALRPDLGGSDRRAPPRSGTTRDGAGGASASRGVGWVRRGRRTRAITA